MDVANSHMWLAQAQLARGDLAAAMASLLAERDAYLQILRRQAGDKDAQAHLATNQVAVANLLALQGQRGAAALLRTATDEIDRLIALEPDNTVYWEQAVSAFSGLSRALLKEGSRDAAGTAAARASGLAEALARKDANETRWQGVLLGTARARVMEAAAARAGTAAERRQALAPAPAESERLARLADKQPANIALASTAAEVSLLVGDYENLAGQTDRARANWAATLERLGRVGLSSPSPIHDRGQVIAAQARERLAGGQNRSEMKSAAPNYGW
jgi:hypothetical protein